MTKMFLYEGILPLYAIINLDAVSLFADLSFFFFSDLDHVIVSDILYQFECMNIVLLL
ncbi:transmembrane protein, putative [Medicago truncatula]|uniref:Transmembrane protein, putative n=1 Tax=Medicago truncatula TaxID=3880 RepID=A0A072V8J0_MEDTR|nr:transmembrane protein, putative [Medicago truncatula]